ncbi:MAG: hypothetical protein M3273_03075 [Actinomycetota bacterium]|nr:hypothetical protein [Actinomycetota bacterium]
MPRRAAAIAGGVIAAALALWLFFPLGCFEEDTASRTGRRRGECPENPTHAGVLWPSSPSGLAGAGVISVVAGAGAGALLWRRLVGPRRRSDDLGW